LVSERGAHTEQSLLVLGRDKGLEGSALKVEARSADTDDTRGMIVISEPDKTIALGSVKTSGEKVLSDTILIQDIVRGQTALIHDLSKIIVMNLDVAVVSLLILIRAQAEATGQRNGLHLASEQNPVGSQRHVEDFGVIDVGAEIAVLEGCSDLVPLVLVNGEWEVEGLEKVGG
jgi:hypothetical protein